MNKDLLDSYVAEVRLYANANKPTREQGRRWYIREHKEAVSLARQMGYPTKVVCACLAVLSPRCQWSRAKSACEALLAGRRLRGTFEHNLAKAAAIINSGDTSVIDPRKAPKTWAFWNNLWRPNDPEPVTLDSWMFRAHGLPPTVGLNTYQVLAAAYRVVASEIELLPNQLQAIVWLYAKSTLRI